MMPASVGSRTSGLRVFLRYVSAGLAVVLSVLAITDRPVRAASSTIVISEFRVRGPNGGNDEFVELYNLSAAPVNISGWKINGSNSAGGTGTRATIPAGKTLNLGCHYLLTNSVPLSYAVSDTCGVATCSLSVTSNEPENGTGDGDTSPDWVVTDSRGRP